jgi:radical SAM superfamily enzyme YgiQ (UPF0313 family)
MKKRITLVYISPGKEIHPAIYYLKDYADKYVGIKDIQICTKVISPEDDITHITKKILSQNPLFIGFSTYIWNVDKTYEIIRSIKKITPTLPIILGGAEASYRAEKILNKNKDIDVIALDEAEETFTELVRYFYDKKQSLSEIQGIMYREGRKIIKTEHRRPLDLKKIPSPFLNKSIPVTKKLIITYETSRGCPFKCAYCSYNTGNYAKLRFFPLSTVNKEISLILKKEPKTLYVADDNFNIYESRAKKILTRMKSLVKKTEINIFLRVDIWKLSESLVKVLAHKNMLYSIGVQSLNLKTLKDAQRIHNREVLDHNIALLAKYKVRVILQFIIGLPGDRYGDIKDMIDWACKYEPYGIQLSTLRINPQTTYEKKAKEFGISYMQSAPYIISKTNTMSSKELIKSTRLAAYFKAVYKNKLSRENLINIHKTTGIPISKIVEELMSKKILNLFPTLTTHTTATKHIATRTRKRPSVVV